MPPSKQQPKFDDPARRERIGELLVEACIALREAAEEQARPKPKVGEAPEPVKPKAQPVGSTSLTEDIYNFIEQVVEATPAQLVREFGISRATAQRHLKLLMEQERIQRRGATKGARYSTT